MNLKIINFSYIVLVLLLLVPAASAELSIKFDQTSKPSDAARLVVSLTVPELEVNFSLLNVSWANVSDYWNTTDYGILNSVSSLNLLLNHSLLRELVWADSGHTGDLNNSPYNISADTYFGDWDGGTVDNFVTVGTGTAGFGPQSGFPTRVEFRGGGTSFSFQDYSEILFYDGPVTQFELWQSGLHTLQIINQAADGTANLDVENNITSDWMLPIHLRAIAYHSTGTDLPFNFYDDGNNIILNMSSVEEEFSIETDNTKIILFNEPKISNDFKVMQIFSKEASDITEFVVTKAGDSHTSYFIRSLAIVGNSTTTPIPFNCSTFANYIDCNTDVTGADLYVQDDLEVNGTIFGVGVNLTGILLQDGSVALTGLWNYETFGINGSGDFTTTGNISGDNYFLNAINSKGNNISFYNSSGFKVIEIEEDSMVSIYTPVTINGGNITKSVLKITGESVDFGAGFQAVMDFTLENTGTKFGVFVLNGEVNNHNNGTVVLRGMNLQVNGEAEGVNSAQERIGATFNINQPLVNNWLFGGNQIEKGVNIIYSNTVISPENQTNTVYTRTGFSSIEGLTFITDGNGGNISSFTSYGFRYTLPTIISTNGITGEFKTYSFYSDGGTAVLGGDNDKTCWGDDECDDASIHWDGTNMIFDYNSTVNPNALAWFSGNISAVSFDTRTSTFDKSAGDAFDYIKDSDYYKDGDEIIHNRFYGFKTYNVVDYSRPEIEIVEEDICKTNQTTLKEYDCVTYTGERTIYPYTKLEEGISLNGEIDVLRQGTYELLLMVEDMKSELCNLGVIKYC